MEILDSLNRCVEIKDGLIKLKSSSVEGFEYAFYLRHPLGLEKKLYSKNSDHCFAILATKGVYVATFFIEKLIK